MKRLTILGASGHGKVIADIARLNGYDEIEFLDDNVNIKYCGVYPVVGNCTEALIVTNDVFVAIGHSETRKKWIDLLSEKTIPVLIHPDAIIAEDVKIGNGTVVMAGVVINPGSHIGKGCIINTCSSVDHDCVVHDFVHVSVGVHLSGTITVGENTWIGAGATVSNNINICSNVTIGAGAVVIKNIDKPGTFIGVPAKLMEK